MSVNAIIRLARDQQIKLATAESCTGGLVAAKLTEQPGSSEIFECGFVTYSNLSKTQLLGVSERSLEQHGAVSEQVAGEMALGALNGRAAQLAVSITGIAGPGGLILNQRAVFALAWRIKRNFLTLKPKSLAVSGATPCDRQRAITRYIFFARRLKAIKSRLKNRHLLKFTPNI